MHLDFLALLFGLTVFHNWFAVFDFVMADHFDFGLAGGGAGGYRTGTLSGIAAGTYTVTVGGGGGAGSTG